MRKEILDGRYSVDTEGNVYGPQGLKNKCINRHGYYTVGIKINGKSKSIIVHRLIAKAFIPNPDNKPQVNHIDGNKLNNSAVNLEWVTNKENSEHAIFNGLFIPLSEHQYKNAGKLNFQKANEIRVLYKTKKYTQKEIGKMYNIGSHQVSKIVNNINWKI